MSSRFVPKRPTGCFLAASLQGLQPFLSLFLPFSQCPLPYAFVHALIHSNDPGVANPRYAPNSPLHQRMCPIRRTRPTPPLGTACPPNTAQNALHKRLRARDQYARLPYFTHRACDQVRLHQLHPHVMWLQLAGECSRPLLKECFTPAVSR